MLESGKAEGLNVPNGKRKTCQILFKMASKEQVLKNKSDVHVISTLTNPLFMFKYYCIRYFTSLLYEPPSICSKTNYVNKFMYYPVFYRVRNKH